MYLQSKCKRESIFLRLIKSEREFLISSLCTISVSHEISEISVDICTFDNKLNTNVQNIEKKLQKDLLYDVFKT